MKKAIIFIFILLLFPATITGQELIDLYKKGKITLNPDPQFSLHLKATPVDSEMNKFNDWLIDNAIGLEQKKFFKDFAINQEGAAYLLASYSRGVVFKFDEHGNYISMFKYGENPKSTYTWGHSIDILDNEYIVVATSDTIVLFDTTGTLYRTIKLDYVTRECIALRDDKIAVIGEDLLEGNGKWKQHVAIIDIQTEKEKTVIDFQEEKKNMFVSAKNGKRWMAIRNPFRKFNICMDKTKAGDLIVGYPEDRKIHIFSPDGDEIGVIKLHYSAIPITQTEKDDHYNELTAFYSKRKIEIRADELKVIKSNAYFPEHWPYYYDIKVDTDDNILVFKYTNDKDRIFRVYQVYSKEGNFICETTIDSAGYQDPNIGRMKFFRGNLYGLLSEKDGTKEEALVKISLTGRSGVDVKNIQQTTTTPGQWTWVSGDSKLHQLGDYGTKGVAASTNKPGARDGSVSWTDSKDNLWLFGGYGYSGTGYSGNLNDLWKYDGTNWTWVSGDIRINQHGVYGTKGVAASTNKPGARYGSVSWTDSKDNLWLFGGVGYDDKGIIGTLHDLWKFDGTNWIWVSGDSRRDQRGVYGIKGVAASTNKPGARLGSVSWIDSKDNLWLFGGRGTGKLRGRLYNDLWKFDGTKWTWVSGDIRRDQRGVYGIKGVAASTNKPGARYGSVSWTDSKDNLWLFGGEAGTIFAKLHNDLWKFDGTNWTWISGDNRRDQHGVYGIKGVAAGTNKPGARYGSVSWTDSKDNLWLFGGWGRGEFPSGRGEFPSGGGKFPSGGGKFPSVSWPDSEDNLWLFGRWGRGKFPEECLLNDLWKFDGTNWTWVSGDGWWVQHGVYGIKGIAASTNKPGARLGSVSWIDSKDNLWLFGGQKLSSVHSRFNDLWKFEP